MARLNDKCLTLSRAEPLARPIPDVLRNRSRGPWRGASRGSCLPTGPFPFGPWRASWPSWRGLAGGFSARVCRLWYIRRHLRCLRRAWRGTRTMRRKRPGAWRAPPGAPPHTRRLLPHSGNALLPLRKGKLTLKLSFLSVIRPVPVNLPPASFFSAGAFFFPAGHPPRGWAPPPLIFQGAKGGFFSGGAGSFFPGRGEK